MEVVLVLMLGVVERLQGPRMSPRSMFVGRGETEGGGRKGMIGEKRVSIERSREAGRQGGREAGRQGGRKEGRE